uniref:Uncharacterized protein n=1 Tax=Sipha flava TaxID=143950 RepID=A0A2S2RA90_9HEMI
MIDTTAADNRLCSHLEPIMVPFVEISNVEKQDIKLCAEDLLVIEIRFEETFNFVTSVIRSTSTILHKNLRIKTVVERVEKGLTTDNIDNTIYHRQSIFKSLGTDNCTSRRGSN